jgi:hypothetical protein
LNAAVSPHERQGEAANGLAPATALWLLSSFCTILQRSFDPASLVRECVPPLEIQDLSRLGKDLGLNHGPRVPMPIFKALVELGTQELEANGLKLPLVAGMQVSAEINQGARTVLDYLVSPVQRVASEAAMER